tara:strand:+ start:1115 stop:3361 length:2247 start_codon:yes stop_codon:yes gene_type:complete
MKKLYIYLFFILNFLFSVEVVVNPYLQSATPNSIKILWETDSESQTIVEWGTQPFLTQNTSGFSFSNYENSKIHTVQLMNLTPNTRYYYRIVIGNYESYSDLYDFITPPEPSSESSFRIIAMSDMQRDNSNPNKFDEIIHDGVIDYMSEEHSDDLAEELAMVLVTGDLVVTGSSYSQWQNHFFKPSEDLFSYVPLYPVFGNHEQNTNYFLNYFDLPENGTEEYDEHWYYTDYSNLRVIGLDSNSEYRIQEQLDWLEETLLDACSNENIDFVFAQLHHPHKSELWTPGEINYTGDVIELMENFTEQCEKPSIHFFGHTHGYSRGQSKDHEHLWVNVATAGGAIDHWGEYPQEDYSEFTVTQDEWGFVLVDVEAGDNPQFKLKRISRGNEETFRDNELRDEIIVRLNNLLPDTPIGLDLETPQNPEFVTLTASNFIDNDADEAMAAEWNVYHECDLSLEPIVNKFVNMENWYYDENTQESIELTQVTVSGLSSNTNYCWSVRYRDTSLGWSNWSEISEFETGESQYSENLILNPGGELGTSIWTVTQGYMESLPEYECDGIEPHTGNYYFIVGALCNTVTYSEAYQIVDLTDYRECIEDGLAYIDYGGYLSNWGGDDHPEMKIAFFNENGVQIQETDILDTYNSSWTLLRNEQQIPENTHYVKMILMGTRYAGDDNDSYFDDLFLRVWQNQTCINLLGDLNQDSNLNVQDIILMINLVLNNDYMFLADINEDNIINVQDVVLLINLILNY